MGHILRLRPIDVFLSFGVLNPWAIWSHLENTAIGDIQASFGIQPIIVAIVDLLAFDVISKIEKICDDAISAARFFACVQRDWLRVPHALEAKRHGGAPERFIA